MQLPFVLRLAYDAGLQWVNDGAPRLGAALAYYTVFSIAPLVLIIIAVAGLFSGQEAAEGKVYASLEGTIGPKSAEFVEEVIVATSKETKSIVATITGILILLLGATGFFAQLQDALDTIWGVRRRGRSPFWATLARYWWSLTMILGIGFLLLVSLVLSAILNGVAEYASPHFAHVGVLLELANSVAGFLLSGVLFALMYKVLPNVRLQWADVWVGAFITALLFSLGKIGLGYYLGSAATTSAYGAAGALVVILLWSYYSAQIFLYGAEFTMVYARSRGSAISPAAGYEVCD